MPASFTLQPNHLRLDRFADDKNTEPETIAWDELCSRLAPPPMQISELTLRSLRAGGYVGLLRNKAGKLENFYFANQDRSGRIAWLLKKEPQFPKQLQKVYRVVAVSWGGEIVEPVSQR